MTTDTQAQHTPGRIKYHAQGDANTYAILIDENDEWLLALLHNGQQATARQEANLRRLAACWNGCDGLSTDDIEGLAEDAGGWPGTFQCIDELRENNRALRAQADDLLATTARQTQELTAARALQAQLVTALQAAQVHVNIRGTDDEIVLVGDVLVAHKSQSAPRSAPAGPAPHDAKAAAANADGQDDGYAVTVDRRDLFDALRAAHREGQGIGQLEGAESWHKATDYADAEIKGWKTMRQATRAAATSAGSLDAQDAARWRETLMHINGSYGEGGARFTLQWFGTLPGADIMKGSVAGHFTAAIDASLKSRAAAKGAGGQGGAA